MLGEMSAEDKAAGRRAAECLPLAHFTRSRPVSGEVIKQLVAMASPLVKTSEIIFYLPTFSSSSFFFDCTVLQILSILYSVNRIMAAAFRSS